MQTFVQAHALEARREKLRRLIEIADRVDDSNATDHQKVSAAATREVARAALAQMGYEAVKTSSDPELTFLYGTSYPHLVLVRVSGSARAVPHVRRPPRPRMIESPYAIANREFKAAYDEAQKKRMADRSVDRPGETEREEREMETSRFG